MHTPRTRFKKQIIAQFLPPRKPSRKVVILCLGLPTIPKKDELLHFFSKKGYWVFLPRYRGTWESGGEFLKRSPHLDIADVIDELPRGFTDIWRQRRYRVKPTHIYIIGMSFGGPAALLNAPDKRVTKVVAVSPVIDWCYPSKEEPLPVVARYVEQAFGEAYRGPRKNWRKFLTGKFYNPISQADKIDGRKVFIIHARDDRSCSIVPVRKFAKQTGSRLKVLPRGGHLPSGIFMKPAIWREIGRFWRSASGRL